MKKYIYIGGFGFCGAILRFAIKNIDISIYNGDIPINTLIINVTGCFLLALVSNLILNILEVNKELRLAITTGFIGTYTTFSSFCKESVSLISSGKYCSSVIYILFSVALGFAAIILGSYTAKIVNMKIKNNIKQEKEDVI